MLAQLISRHSSPPACAAAGTGSIGRARRILRSKLTYIDHPSFRDSTVRDTILAPSADSVDDQVARPWQSPEWRARLPAGRSRAPVLTRDQEVHLFRKMNYLKCRANRLKEHLDPGWPDPGDLDEIDRLQSEALAIKNRIVEMNLGLVVSIAKTRSRPGSDLAECVSDGNLALIQAVDGFDFSLGYRFSSYASWAIRNAFAEHERTFIRGRSRPFSLDEKVLEAPDPGVNEHEFEAEQNQRRALVARWLGRLEKRERRILVSRYGIGGVPKLTLAQIGQELGISQERVRQVQVCALAQLRKLARLENIETLEI